MVSGTLSKRIHGIVGLMMLDHKNKLLTLVAFGIVAMMLVSCGTPKKTNVMSDFMNAIASGDISPLKTIKGAKDKDDGSWDSIDKDE